MPKSLSLTVLNKIIFYALLITIALTSVYYGTTYPVSLAVFECFIFFLAFIWIIEGSLRQSGIEFEPRLFTPLICIAIFMALQTLHFGNHWFGGSEIEPTMSHDPFATRLVLLKFSCLILLATMLWHYTSSFSRIFGLINLIIIVGVSSALFGVGRYLYFSNAPLTILPDLRTEASFGQFLSRNHFAVLMEMTLGLLLGISVARNINHRPRLIYLLLAFFVWVALILSNSRGGIFSMIVQFPFLFFAHRLRWQNTMRNSLAIFGRHLPLRTIQFLSGAVLILSVVTGTLLLGSSRLGERLEAISYEFRSDVTVSETGETGSNRQGIWKATWKLIEANPIVGVGFGGYGTAIDKFADPAGAHTVKHAHNDYLELLASGGLVAAMLSLWFVLALQKLVRQNLRSTTIPFHRDLCVGALAGLFSVGLHSLVDYGLQTTINACVFIVLLIIVSKCEPGRGLTE